MTEKFNLKWNDFQTNASKSFGLFRNESYLHDVTLVSDDYKQIPAHKLVLSACSEYFRSIFMQTKQSQPLLCLDGVSAGDIQNVLDYVYEGEVKIYQEELDRFLNVAQKLKLEGLMSDKEKHNNEEDELETMEPVIEETETSRVNYEESRVQQRQRDTKRPLSNTQPESFHGTVSLPDITTLSNGENVIDNGDETLSCAICGKIVRGKNRKWDMKKHLEVHTEGVSYNCPVCQKSFRSKNSFTYHKSHYHRF